MGHAAVLIAVLGSAPAMPPEAGLSDRARRAFEEGLRLRGDPVRAKERFRAAAAVYEQLRKRGTENAALFRSQGNASLLAGDLPQAIFAYRRGLRLAPADGALQEALAAAREDVARKVTGGFGRPPADDRPPWLPRVGFSGWSFALLLLVYVLCCLSLARWAMTRRQELLLASGIGLLLTGLAAALLGLASLYEKREQARALVVIAQDDLPLLLGNGLSYKSRYVENLPRGAEARVLFRRSDWLQIELSGGEIGWVPLSTVLLDDS